MNIVYTAQHTCVCVIASNNFPGVLRFLLLRIVEGNISCVLRKFLILFYFIDPKLGQLLIPHPGLFFQRQDNEQVTKTLLGHIAKGLMTVHPSLEVVLH
jgi:hypothetical protein